MKYNRQSMILDIIDKYDVETQEELQDLLKNNGIEVTQATISRDIKELKLIKLIDNKGKMRYSIRNKYNLPISSKLLSIFVHAYVSSDYANNIVVVKTLSGMAQAVAATIDTLDDSGIVGTIAGDDTLMIICRAEQIAEELTIKFDAMRKENMVE